MPQSKTQKRLKAIESYKNQIKREERLIKELETKKNETKRGSEKRAIVEKSIARCTLRLERFQKHIECTQKKVPHGAA